MSKVKKTEAASDVTGKTTEPKVPTNISCLPPEVLGTIFNKLSKQEKGRLTLACIAFRNASYQPAAWRGVAFPWTKDVNLSDNPTLCESLDRRRIRSVVLRIDEPGSAITMFEDVARGVSKIQALRIGTSEVTDQMLSYPALLTEMPCLTVLNLTGCVRVTDQGIEQIAQHLNNLTSLDLTGCSNITDKSLEYISNNLKKLKTLSLQFCYAITKTGIEHLCRHDNGVVGANSLRLERLELLGCTEVSDSTLQQLSIGQPWIKFLGLNFCLRLSDLGMKFLAKLPNLLDLQLSSHEEITNEGFVHLVGVDRLAGVHQLQVLFLQRMFGLTDVVVQSVAKLANLRELIVDGCPAFNDVGMRHLATMSSLQEISFTYCPITDEGLASLAEGGSKVVCLDLTLLNFTDEGFRHISRLSALQRLHLSLCLSVRGSGFEHFSTGTARITSLDISRSRFPDEQTMAHIARMNDLHILRTNEQQLNDETMIFLTQSLPRLRSLYCGKNEYFF